MAMESARLMLLVAVMGSSVAGFQVVDLTYDFWQGSVFWPGSPEFKFYALTRINASAGIPSCPAGRQGPSIHYMPDAQVIACPGLSGNGDCPTKRYAATIPNNLASRPVYESNSFFTPEHGGTHVDSPAHFMEGSWRVSQIPADHLLGPAVLLDVKDKAARDADYRVTVQDLKDWEKVHGRMPAKSVVLMYSGWGSRYPNTSSVFNTPTLNDSSTFHFPGFHPDAATFLATQRDVIALGVDTPSTDYGQSPTFPTHVILGEHNILGLENVANLDRLPARGATVFIGVIKLVDGSGAPARMVALVGDGADIFGPDTGGTGRNTAVSGWLLFCLVLLRAWSSLV